MIDTYDFALALAAELRARMCPVDVLTDGDPRGRAEPATFRDEYLVVADDDQQSGSFAAPRTPGGNPRRLFRWLQPIRIAIYARSQRPNALPFEHRRRASRIARTVAASVLFVTRRAQWDIGPISSRWITLQAMEGSDSPAGAAIELRLNLISAVEDVSFDGAAAPEIAVSEDGTDGPTFSSETIIGATNETACGEE